MANRADGLQTLQRVHNQARDTLRIDALMFETTDGGTTWVPIANLLQDGGTALVHLYVFQGGTWVPWGGASAKESHIPMVEMASDTTI